MIHTRRGFLSLMIAFCVPLLNGCIKNTSSTVFEEVELRAASQVTLVNALGTVKLSGAIQRNAESAVLIKTEKYVDTYSLFGLAKPNDYLNLVMTAPTHEDGAVSMNVTLVPRGVLDRLLVRVVPHVNRTLETPTTIKASVEVNVGDVELNNLPGDVRAKVNAGRILASPAMGVYGEQRYEINIGDLEMALPLNADLRYKLQADIGAISTRGVELSLQNRFLGARATGALGLLSAPGYVDAKVNIGSILVRSE